MSGAALQDRITYVVVDTDAHALALRALERSMASFPVRDVVVLSDDPAKWGAFAGQVRRIAPLRGLEDYQDWSVRRLAEHVATDFCIVLQWDGFVVNPREFSALFRHYDYIGAPWPHFEQFNVGNSGFNWRSRKLLEASARLADQRAPGEADDTFLCRRMRVTLEQHAGIRFAPEGVAAHFSVEHKPVPWPTFGFHGVRHLPTAYRGALPFLVDNLSDRAVMRNWRLLAKVLGGAGDDVLARLRARVAAAERRLGSPPAPAATDAGGPANDDAPATGAAVTGTQAR